MTGGGASLVAVSLAVAAAALVAMLGEPRTAGYLLAATLAVLALARAVLPLRAIGPFAVRSRAVDVGVCAAFAVVLAAVSYALPG